MPPLSPPPSSSPPSLSPRGDPAVPSAATSPLRSERRRPAPAEGPHPWVAPGGCPEGLSGPPGPPHEKRWPATHSQTSGAAVPGAGSRMSGTKPHCWPWPWDSTTKRCSAAAWSSGSPGENRGKNSSRNAGCGGWDTCEASRTLELSLCLRVNHQIASPKIKIRVGDAENGERGEGWVW